MYQNRGLCCVDNLLGEIRKEGNNLKILSLLISYYHYKNLEGSEQGSRVKTFLNNYLSEIAENNFRISGKIRTPASDIIEDVEKCLEFLQRFISDRDTVVFELTADYYAFTAFPRRSDFREIFFQEFLRSKGDIKEFKITLEDPDYLAGIKRFQDTYKNPTRPKEDKVALGVRIIFQEEQLMGRDPHKRVICSNSPYNL